MDRTPSKCVEVDIEDGEKSGKRDQRAKRKAIKNFLLYYNCRADDAYVQKLSLLGDEDEGTSMCEELEYFSNDDPKTKTVQYLMALPHKYCDTRQLEQAPSISIKSMIQSEIVKYQYAFSLKDFEEKISKLKTILSDSIGKGIDSYDGKIENSPDIEFQLKKLDELIPSLKGYFFDNKVRYRSGENDLVEIGFNSSFSPIYIRLAPHDGENGSWRMK